MTATPIASPELPDLDNLEALARAATPGRWMRLFGERTVYDRMEDGCRGNAIVRADLGYGLQDISNLDFIAGANPAAVLELIALARRAAIANQPAPTVSLEDRPEDDQQWAKVDPAIAFHLIERHAEDWADAGRLMLQWYNAISRAAQQEPAAAPQQAAAPGALAERDPSKPAEQQGLFRKFDVRRTDGSDQLGEKHHGCRYYVLDLTHDQHAPAAMRAYAAACASTHPQLAADIVAEFSAPGTPEAPKGGVA